MSSILEALYFKSPRVLQNAGISYTGRRTNQRRYSEPFPTRLLDYRNRSRWREEQVLAFRDGRLNDTLYLAAQTPFYKQLFQSLGADWRDFCDPNTFAELPMTTKADLRRGPLDFAARPLVASDQVLRTSGTSGSALAVNKSRNAVAEQWAVWWRYRMTHGLTISTWVALFAGRRVIPEQAGPPYWRVNRPGKEVRYSAYHISPTTAEAYVRDLNTRRVPWIHGFASAISNLAHLMLLAGVSLDYRPTAVTLGGENLKSWQADNIEHAFGIRPVQHYGLAESVANLSQCSMGSLHVDEDFAMVEFVPTDESAAMQIVGTNFGNGAMVILRYATNDLVSLETVSCECGAWGRVVASLDGRGDDTLVLPDGRVLGSPEDAFRAIPGVAEAQIIQRSGGELLVQYVKGIGWSNATPSEIEKNIRDFVGHLVNLTVREVSAVEKTQSGKTRLVVSEARE